MKRTAVDVKRASDYAPLLPAERTPENCIVVVLDDAGYVVGPIIIATANAKRVTGAKRALVDAARAIAKPAYQMMRELPRPELEPADIAWPDAFWPVDADGRGLSVLEVERGEHLRTPLTPNAEDQAA